MYAGPGRTDLQVNQSVLPRPKYVGTFCDFILFTVAILIIVTFISNAISISVCLFRIRDRQTVITSVTYTISVCVVLVQIFYEDAVILV